MRVLVHRPARSADIVTWSAVPIAGLVFPKTQELLNSLNGFLQKPQVPLGAGRHELWKSPPLPLRGGRAGAGVNKDSF